MEFFWVLSFLAGPAGVLLMGLLVLGFAGKDPFPKIVVVAIPTLIGGFMSLSMFEHLKDAYYVKESDLLANAQLEVFFYGVVAMVLLIVVLIQFLFVGSEKQSTALSRNCSS